MGVATLSRASGGTRSAGNITFQQERIADVYTEAADLLIRHWHEVAFYKDIRINPDMGSYLAAEAKGLVSLTTVRADKQLIGYILYLIAPNSHYKVLQATDDLHFLRSDYRKSGIALKMFRFAEAEMKKRGVVLLFGRTKADPKLNHGAIFEHLGYDKQDIIYSKRLDRGS